MIGLVEILEHGAQPFSVLCRGCSRDIQLEVVAQAVVYHCACAGGESREAIASAGLTTHRLIDIASDPDLNERLVGPMTASAHGLVSGGVCRLNICTDPTPVTDLVTVALRPFPDRRDVSA